MSGICFAGTTSRRHARCGSNVQRRWGGPPAAAMGGGVPVVVQGRAEARRLSLFVAQVTACLSIPQPNPPSLQPIIPSGWVWMYWLDPVSYTLYGGVGGRVGREELVLITHPRRRCCRNWSAVPGCTGSRADPDTCQPLPHASTIACPTLLRCCVQASSLGSWATSRIPCWCVGVGVAGGGVSGGR